MINEAPFTVKGRKTLLLADGQFSSTYAKTAACFLRYREGDVVAVLDHEQAGRTAADVLGYGGSIPIVASVEEAKAFHPEIALVGVAPRGGGLDDTFRKHIIECIEAHLDIISGLHVFLMDNAEIKQALSNSTSRIWDVRRVSSEGTVASGHGCMTGARTVLTVGTDCGVGKMTVAYELYLEALSRGLNVSWAATGQTGMILRERGIAVDRVIGDFIGGAAEELVNIEGKGKDIVFVEGQGSLIHPGYASVTVGLMFGVMPDCMVLVHDVARKKVKDHDDIGIPPLAEMIRHHQFFLSPLKKVPVAAISLNTGILDEAEAQSVIRETSRMTCLSTGDLVRFGSTKVLDAILDCLDRVRG